MKLISSKEEFDQVLKENAAVAVYFAHDNCNVCKVLKPKLSEALTEKFPKVEQVCIDIENTPELAGQHGVFTVPVVLLFLEGQELLRKSRNFGIGEVMDCIERPYSIMFE
jgi:thioredoxin-like negative regulator of GroEL